MSTGDLFLAFLFVALAIAVGFVAIALTRIWRGGKH